MSWLMLLVGFLSNSVNAIETTGSISLLNRQFEADANPTTTDQHGEVNLELQVSSKINAINFKLEPFIRVDYYDSSRNFLNPQDSYISYSDNQSSWKLGYSNYNWSVLETFHTLNIVNAQNFDSASDNLEYISDPALTYNYITDASEITLSIFLDMPNPKLPGQTNRNSGGFIFNETRFVEDNRLVNQAQQASYALSYTHFFDGLDLNMHYLRRHNTTTNTLIAPKQSLPLSPLELTTYNVSFMANHYGVSTQSNWESWLLKTQSLLVDFENDPIESITFNPLTGYGVDRVLPKDHIIHAIGLERSINFSNNTSIDFYLEWQKFFNVSATQAKRLNAFQNDATIGFGYNLNDIQRTRVEFIAITDLAGEQETLYQVQYQRFIRANLKLQANLRIIDAKELSSLDLDQVNGLRPLAQTDALSIMLKQYF